MALFRFVLMSGVLRGFSACDVLDVRLGGNPCAALLIEKLLISKLETNSCYPFLKHYHFRIGPNSDFKICVDFPGILC